MELTNEFSVAVPVNEAWAVLTDLERIAPCMPGAELHEVEGDEYRGVVKVKVGPITAQYKGKATFAERDEAAFRAVIRAEGRDTKGQGNASATITATLESEGNGTRVKLVTDLSITGKVAQFGRGVLADVSGKLLDKFVQSLESDVLVGAGQSTATPPSPEPATSPQPPPRVTEVVDPGESAVRRIAARPAEPVDLLATAGQPLRKLLGLLAVLFVVLLWLRGRRRKQR